MNYTASMCSLKQFFNRFGLMLSLNDVSQFSYQDTIKKSSLYKYLVQTVDPTVVG